ncbi:MAG: DUF4097 family beta strand repeat-containing protein [Steroidobacteraceae bacterium]
MRIGFSLIALLGAGALAATADARVLQQQVNADPAGEVDVSNVAGSIEVSAWDRPEVAVQADIDTDWQHLEVSSERGFTSVRVTGRHTTSFWGGFWGGFRWTTGAARLQVWVPRASKLDVSAVSAEVTSRGMLGVQHLHSVSGDITADVTGADTEVKTVSGEIRLRSNGQPGSLELGTVSGDVQLVGAAGDLRASTVSGEVSAALSPAHNVRLRTSSGSLRLTGRFARDATLDGQTVSGDLTVQAAGDTGYAYEARTLSGSLEDCFGRPAERVSEYGPGKILTGTVGAGGASLRFRTVSGDVSICDH